MEWWRWMALGGAALGLLAALWLSVWEGQIGGGLVLVLSALLSFLFGVVERYPPLSLHQKHVVVTGGSSGIGYAVALACVKEGAHVSIIARDVNKLKEAEETLTRASPNAKVCSFSCDVSNAEKIRETLDKAANAIGKPIDVVVMSAGVSYPLYFEDYSDDEFERVMRINYLGSVHTVRAALPQLKRNGGGRLVFISSLAGLVGMTGFSTYSPSKFAVRGLAETLHMELQPYNIQVTLVNPADVDTPMYAEEMKNKPLACRRISEGSGVLSPAVVADDVISSIKDWRFMVNTGFDGTILGYLTCGVSPASSVTEAFLQIFSMGILRIVGLFLLRQWNDITVQSWEEEKKGK